MMFLKLKSWNKVCILISASIFECGWLQELGRLLALGRILSRRSTVKKLQLLRMMRTLLFIELSGRLYGLESG